MLFTPSMLQQVLDLYLLSSASCLHKERGILLDVSEYTEDVVTDWEQNKFFSMLVQCKKAKWAKQLMCVLER